jgi:hypothetical protein
MKRIVLILGFGLLSLFVFFSCLSEHDDVFVSYGVIRNVNSANDYEILTDKGNTLKVTKSQTIQTIENDKRVLVNFEILSDKDSNRKIYEVSVNGFYNLLSKPVVYESFILQDEEARRDSIGNDPFTKILADFGGEFINIDFEVYYMDYSTVKHMINLVYDDTRADADTLYLSLHHNAYGEVPGKGLSLSRGVGRSSFKISDLLPVGVTSKPVKITWTEYNHYETRTRSSSGIFKLSYSTNENFRLAKDIGLDSSIEIR